jgi:DNA-binding MarR family transcriptional regulator
LSKAFYGIAMPSGSGSDLTEAEREALRLFGHRGECMMREVAAACEVALSTMTGIVDRLVKKGLVQRRHSEADRRVVLVRLTARGQLAYQERLDADMRLVLSMLHALQPEEQRQFVTLVQKIVQRSVSHGDATT